MYYYVFYNNLNLNLYYKIIVHLYNHQFKLIIILNQRYFILHNYLASQFYHLLFDKNCFIHQSILTIVVYKIIMNFNNFVIIFVYFFGITQINLSVHCIVLFYLLYKMCRLQLVLLITYLVLSMTILDY